LKLYFPVPSCFGIGWDSPWDLYTDTPLFSLRIQIFTLQLYNACSCCSPFKEVTCSLTGGSCLCNCAVSINKFEVDVLVIVAEGNYDSCWLLCQIFLAFCFREAREKHRQVFLQL